MERVEGQTIEVSECCGASVEPCVSCGDDTPVHTECVECRSLIEWVGEEGYVVETCCSIRATAIETL